MCNTEELKKEIKDTSYELKKRLDLLLNITEEDQINLIQRLNSIIDLTESEVLKRDKDIFPKLGEIWLVNLGTNIGTEMNNVRPCIVVSYDEYNNKSGTVTIIPITRAPYSHMTQFVIDESCVSYVHKNIEGTVKAEQITTKSKTRFSCKIGELNKKGLDKLNIILINHLNLSDCCSEEIQKSCFSSNGDSHQLVGIQVSKEEIPVGEEL